MERPKSIVAFERAFWGSVAVGLLGGILGWNDLLETYQRESSIAAMGFGSGFLIAVWCISLAFQLLFWYLIARKGSNVTRWIYVVLMGFGIISALATIGNPAMPGGISRITSLASTALTVAAIFFLFRPDASDWFTKKRQVDPATFS